MNNIGIYKIINKIDGKYYVGSSIKISTRWNNHQIRLNRHVHDNPHLQNAWNKFGCSNFDFIIVEKTEKSNVLLVEQKYLDIAKTEPEKCYNMTFIAGGGNLGEESLKKIGAALRGKPRSEETRKKISETLKKRKKTKKEIVRLRENWLEYRNSNEYKKPKWLTTFDSKQYHFVNVLTNEEFVGTRTDFKNKFNIPSTNVNSLVREERKQLVSGWKMGFSMKDNP